MATNEGSTVIVERNSEEHKHIQEAVQATGLAVAWSYRGRTRVHIWKGSTAICKAPGLFRNYNRAVDTEGWCPDCLRELEARWRRSTAASQSGDTSAPAQARQKNPKEQTRYTEVKAVLVYEGRVCLNVDPQVAVQELEKLLADAYPDLGLGEMWLHRSGREVAHAAPTQEASSTTSPSGSTPIRCVSSRSGQLRLV